MRGVFANMFESAITAVIGIDTDAETFSFYVDLGDKNLADVLASDDAIFTINYIPTESDVEMGAVNVQFVNFDAEGNRLAQGEVAIEYMYAFAEGDMAHIVVRPTDIELCEKALN